MQAKWIIVAKRKINYGPIDPKYSREIFIRGALVEGEYNTRAPFFKQDNNGKLLFLTKEDLMQHAADNVTVHMFPDYIYINSMTLPLSYHFEPRHELDGVTVKIPVIAALVSRWNRIFGI